MSNDVHDLRIVGLILLGMVVLQSSVDAQELPPALPEIEASPSAIESLAPTVPTTPLMPTPSVIEVPAMGIVPGWAPGPIDPVVTARHQPKFVEHKRRWWHWRRYQGKLGGYRDEFVPRPLGAALHDHGRTMVANGAAARLTLYRYDFVDGSGMLNQRGLDQVSKLALQLAASSYPLIIERTPENPALAEARRLSVVSALESGPYPVSAERVLVGLPIARGLSGIDAQIIGVNSLERTKEFGPPIPINSNGVNSPSGVTSR